MSRSARARLVWSAAAALLFGALGGACGSSPPMDRNFGTDLGADFRAPITDAGSVGDTNVAPEASVDGAVTGGATGNGGGAGTTGAAGGGGTAGEPGVGGATGNAGAAGAGS